MKKIVAGNWKMNLSPTEAEDLMQELSSKGEVEGVELIVFPPYIYLNKARFHGLEFGGQNCYPESNGAYTGEISVSMLEQMGAKYCLVGHSERREYFGEDSEFLKRKVDALLEAGLTPVFCCGEPLEVRENGDQEAYVITQLREALQHLSKEQMEKVVLAYEPIWAIGTGLTASPEQAQEMHASIRAWLVESWGLELASEVPVLYGGSCKPDNAKEIFAGKDVDGGLIGGAALKAESFLAIARSF